MSPWVDRLGWTLIHFLWQGTLIAALYAITRRLPNPRVRYLLACAAIATMMAAPVITFTLTAAGSHAPANPLTANVPRAAIAARPISYESLPVIVSVSRSEEVMPWLVAAWFAGATIFWLRLTGGWIAAVRMKSKQAHSAPAEWQQKLNEIKTSIQISQPVKLLVSALVQVPTVIGWLHPIVLVPVGALAGLPPDHVEALLAHELAHIRRHDYLVNILQSIAEALLFYHPAVWWISSQIRSERELCCDDVAVATSGDALTYAHALADLESTRLEHFNPALAVSGGSLPDRIARLLGIARQPSRILPGPGVILCAAAILATAFAAFSQPAAPPFFFDVASIKPNNSGDNHQQVRVAPGGRLNAVNASLRVLITAAYQIQDFELSGGPAWQGSARFDIVAKGQENATGDQIMQMLQTLLADRFQLKIHKEIRELPVYALVVAKNGSKLQASRDDVACFVIVINTPPPTPDARPCGGFNQSSPTQMQGAKVTTARLAKNLGRNLGRTVVDKTGLDGIYDVTLKWTPEETQALPADPSAEDNAGSIFTAVQEQLGLRLESQKGPVEILVIDSVEKPSEN